MQALFLFSWAVLGAPPWFQLCQFGRGVNRRSRDMMGVMKRAYGTGSLFTRVDQHGRETWYGSWRVGTTRIKRKLGVKRSPSRADGLTRAMAERELRKRMGTEQALPVGSRRSLQQSPALRLARGLSSSTFSSE